MQLKIWWLSLLLSIPLVLADIGQTLSNVWAKVMYIAGLGFLDIGPDIWLIAFTRLMVWILVFAIFFALLRQWDEWIKRNQALVIAFCLATIAAIFLPASILLATGAGWATLVSFLLIGAPIVGIGLILIYLPSDSCPWIFLKLMLCLLLLWILSAMKYHVGVLAGGI